MGKTCKLFSRILALKGCLVFQNASVTSTSFQSRKNQDFQEPPLLSDTLLGRALRCYTEPHLTSQAVVISQHRVYLCWLSQLTQSKKLWVIETLKNLKSVSVRCSIPPALKSHFDFCSHRLYSACRVCLWLYGSHAENFTHLLSPPRDPHFTDENLVSERFPNLPKLPRCTF